MMKHKTILGIAALALVMLAAPPSVPAQSATDAALAKAPSALGWHLASQCWTFRDRTFVETLQTVKGLGLDTIEVYSSQSFSADEPFKTGHGTTPEQRAAMKKAAADAGISLMGYGVITVKTEAEWEAVFAFAKEMGMQYVNSEPPMDQIPMIDALAGAAGIKMALHNHPKPKSIYWNPATVLEGAALGTPGRWGACADTGHWVRSELDPIEGLKLLDGKIQFLHFKDLNQVGPGAHDVVWGTGVSNVYGALAQLKEQGYKGFFNIEYEHMTPELESNVAASIRYFQLASAALDSKGWTPLFNQPGLPDAEMPFAEWSLDADGVLTPGNKGDIWTKTEYGNYVLDLEFKCAPSTNSGVFLRCASIADWLNTAIEVQILQKGDPMPRRSTGGLYDVAAPSDSRLLPVGEWNRYTIMALDNMLYVVLNGKQVLNVDLDQWKEAGKNPDGSPNKFRYAYADLARKGRVGLQYHNEPVWFRNVRIKSLD